MTTGGSGLAFDSYQPEDERRRESLFGLGNGVLFVRGCASDVFAADSAHYPGTYRAGCYNRAASTIRGAVVEDESLVNLPNWLPLTFRRAGEASWFALDGVRILGYRHVLDLRHGLLRRWVRFRDAAGRESTIAESRLVSMVRPHCAAFRLELTPENWDGTIELRSALQLDSSNTLVARHAPFTHRHLDLLRCDGHAPDLLTACLRTRQSHVEVALAVRTRVDAAHAQRQVQREGDWLIDGRSCALRRGQALAVEKTAAIVTSRDLATGNPLDSARTGAAEAPAFAELQAEHAQAWARLRRCGPIHATSPALAQASRLHRFHVLQTISPLSAGRDVGFPARGWQEAYRGQIFWDEIFVFPFLNLRFPEIARSLLLYRYYRLEEARRAARRCGLRGAMYPWRSASTGEEVTPQLQLNLLTGGWSPDDTRLQRHIGAAIAYNVWQYFLATGDTAFLAAYGAEMILEIARFWASLARRDPADGRYDISGVIGPDEYHNAYPDAPEPGLHNNAYTNVMAVWTLCRGLEVLGHVPSPAREGLWRKLQLSDAELAAWDDVSRNMRLEFHDGGILSQFAGFAQLQSFDVAGFAHTHSDRANWALEREGQSTDALQMTKQADVLMLFHLLLPDELATIFARLGYALDEARLRRTAGYYLQRLTHESSLSRVVCAGALAQLDRAASWRYFQQAMCLDLVPSGASGTVEGVHLGAMAGTLDVLQRHYLGLRVREHGLALCPAPPEGLGGVRLDFMCRGDSFSLENGRGGIRLRASQANVAAMPVEQCGMLHPGASMTVPVARGDAEPDSDGKESRS